MHEAGDRGTDQGTAVRQPGPHAGSDRVVPTRGRLVAAGSPGTGGCTPAPDAVGRPAMTDAELDDRLAELLTRQGIVPAATLDRARTFQRSQTSTLAGALAALHLVSSDVLRGLLEELTGTRAVDPSLMTVYPDFVARVNQLLPAGPRRAPAGLPGADGDQRAARVHAEPHRRVDDPRARSAVRAPRVPLGDARGRGRRGTHPALRRIPRRPGTQVPPRGWPGGGGGGLPLAALGAVRVVRRARRRPRQSQP